MNRWLTFYGVGALGIGVQLLALTVFGRAGVALPLATALAVEAAVLHNFAWHERFTWRDRPSRGGRELLARLAKFNVSNGAVSLAGNVVLTSLFVHALSLAPVVANVLSVACCSVVNYVLADQVVFRVRESEG